MPGLHPKDDPIPLLPDISMRSASPSISELIRSRIPAAIKEKHNVRPWLASSANMAHTFDTVDLPASPSPSTRHPRFGDPDESVLSVYPPVLPQYREERVFYKPVAPSALLNCYRVLESDMRARGPPLANSPRTDEFPRITQPLHRAAPLPPDPYINEGEAADEDSMRPSGLRDFVTQQQENVPIEHDAFFKHTPKPVGGFPQVHFASPVGAFENIADSQLIDWEREVKDGLVAMGVAFYRCGALNGTIDPRYRQLISFATHLLNTRFQTDRITIAQP